jgi:hypothetical protein
VNHEPTWDNERKNRFGVTSEGTGSYDGLEYSTTNRVTSDGTGIHPEGKSCSAAAFEPLLSKHAPCLGGLSGFRTRREVYLEMGCPRITLHAALGRLHVCEWRRRRVSAGVAGVALGGGFWMLVGLGGAGDTMEERAVHELHTRVANLLCADPVAVQRIYWRVARREVAPHRICAILLFARLLETRA